MAHGDGSATQLPNGKWRADKDFGLTATGRRRRISATGKTEAEARRKVRRKIADLGTPTGGSRKRTANSDKKNIASWSTTWLTTRVSEVRPNTYSSDRAAVNHYIVPTVGRVRLTDVMPADLADVERAVRDAGHGPKTVLRTRRVMVKMLRDALEAGYTVPSAVFNVKVKTKPGTQRKPVREALTTGQAIGVLAQAAELPHGSRYLVGFYQGMRQGETLGLTWDAIDFDNNTISLEWQLQPLPYLDKTDRSKGFRIPDDYEARHLQGRFHLVRPKTDSGWRVIPMVPTIREALTTWRDTSPPNPHGLVWARPNGWPIDKADDLDEFKTLQKLAKVQHPSGRPFVGHEMRNTCATILNELGADPVTIQAILGHSSFAISQGYMTARQPKMLAALEGVAGAFTTKAIG